MHPAKATVVSALNSQLNASPFVFVTDYAGLDVIQFSELRTRLDKVGARVIVVKNSFLRLALKEAGLPDVGELRGQTAVVVGDKDAAAAAKVLKTFTGEFKKLSVKTGVLDNLVVGPEQINAIADLPSREVLLATLLGVLQAPASKLVRLLNEPARQLAHVLRISRAGSPFSRPDAQVANSELQPARRTPSPSLVGAATERFGIEEFRAAISAADRQSASLASLEVDSPAFKSGADALWLDLAKLIKFLLISNEIGQIVAALRVVCAQNSTFTPTPILKTLRTVFATILHSKVISFDTVDRILDLLEEADIDLNHPIAGLDER